MKGYCPICKKVIDEVVYSQFGMCHKCYTGKIRDEITEMKKKAMIEIKHKNLVLIKKTEDGDRRYHYVCNTVNWNYFLNRYYPNAELTMVCETINL